MWHCRTTPVIRENCHSPQEGPPWYPPVSLFDSLDRLPQSSRVEKLSMPRHSRRSRFVVAKSGGFEASDSGRSAFHLSKGRSIEGRGALDGLKLVGELCLRSTFVGSRRTRGPGKPTSRALSPMRREKHTVYSTSPPLISTISKETAPPPPNTTVVNAVFYVSQHGGYHYLRQLG